MQLTDLHRKAKHSAQILLFVSHYDKDVSSPAVILLIILLGNQDQNEIFLNTFLTDGTTVRGKKDFGLFLFLLLFSV